MSAVPVVGSSSVDSVDADADVDAEIVAAPEEGL